MPFYFFNQPDLVMYFVVRATLETVDLLHLFTNSISCTILVPSTPPHLLQNKQTYKNISTDDKVPLFTFLPTTQIYLTNMWSERSHMIQYVTILADLEFSYV